MDSPVRDYETPAARSNPVTVASASGERRGRPKVPTADYMFTAKERGDVRFTKNFNVTTGNGSSSRDVARARADEAGRGAGSASESGTLRQQNSSLFASSTLDKDLREMRAGYKQDVHVAQTTAPSVGRGMDDGKKSKGWLDNMIANENEKENVKDKSLMDKQMTTKKYQQPEGIRGGTNAAEEKPARKYWGFRCPDGEDARDCFASNKTGLFLCGGCCFWWFAA